MNNYLLYQAYGHKDFYHECLYSLYSLTQFQFEGSIVIYTDNRLYLSNLAPSDLNIVYREVTPKDIVDWRGEIDFVHRVKIMILKDFHDTYDGKYNLLYIDTDTTFLMSPSILFDRISEGKLIMLENEGSIQSAPRNNIIFSKIKKYQNSSSKYGNLIPADQDMWNAGALGMRSTDSHMLEQVLDITDKVYTEFPKHIIEQLAFSIILSSIRDRELIASDTVLFHYWFFKEYRAILGAFFDVNQTENDIKKHFDLIDARKLSQPKSDYLNASFIKKSILKLKGKWKMPQYQLTK